MKWKFQNSNTKSFKIPILKGIDPLISVKVFATAFWIAGIYVAYVFTNGLVPYGFARFHLRLVMLGLAFLLFAAGIGLWKLRRWGYVAAVSVLSLVAVNTAMLRQWLVVVICATMIILLSMPAIQRALRNNLSGSGSKDPN